MPNVFSVTYEIFGESEIEAGETDRRGYVVEKVGLREAVRELGGIAIQADTWPLSRRSPPRWFDNYEYGHCYCTGDRESRSPHLPRNVTPSSALRVARLLGLNVNQ